MISIIITSFKEPKTIGRAIEHIIQQDIQKPYELIVSAPDKETLKVAQSYQADNKNIVLFQDPGKGKSYAINLLFKKVRGDIIILTDGDVYVSGGSINKIIDLFKDSRVGCVSGRPVSIENKNYLLGYWSHMLCDAAHLLRIERHTKNKFLECSGYFWAFRNHVINAFPLDVAEDSIVPVLFWKKGYRIRYSPESIVYVSYPKNLSDYVKQKKRTIKSHEKIPRYVKNPPQMKTFLNELSGMIEIFRYSKNARELLYSFLAIPFRGYLWIVAYKEFLLKKEYQDAWERVESTKNL